MQASEAPPPEGAVRSRSSGPRVGEASPGGKKPSARQQGSEKMPYFDSASNGLSDLAVLHLLAQMKGFADPTAAPSGTGKEADSMRPTDSNDVVRDCMCCF